KKCEPRFLVVRLFVVKARRHCMSFLRVIACGHTEINCLLCGGEYRTRAGWFRCNDTNNVRKAVELCSTCYVLFSVLVSLFGHQHDRCFGDHVRHYFCTPSVLSGKC
ncbi:unnamed protein product, partial [Ectocarpus sp. 8 AP-2014]